MVLNPLVFLIHLLATFFMTGVIWIIQSVHYPSFQYVSSENFFKFTQFHQMAMTWIVGPMMLVELITGLYLWSQNPLNIYWFILSSLILLIWLSTFFLSVPLHETLVSQGYDLKVIQKLIFTNWPRTISWSLRSVLLIQLAAQYVFSQKV